MGDRALQVTPGDVTAPTATVAANMAEEEDKKGEDKGDHINLKVKDQVRAASDGTRADRQKTRAIKPRHLLKTEAETVACPPFRRTTRRCTSRSGRPPSLRRYVPRQIPPSQPPGRASHAPRAVRFLRTYFLVPAVFSRAEPLALPPPRRSSRLSAPTPSASAGCRAFLFDGQRINPTQTPRM